ncbi:hypothetical protein HYS47_03425 [Candidatus Woesearchaeota archaeon]|nr:hypothetical protein [Candidatus Woesearchaeota archaeon]
MTGQLVDKLEDWRLPHNFTEALVVELFRRSGWKLSRRPVSSVGRRERTVDDVVERVREFYPRYPVEAVRPTFHAVMKNFPHYTTTDVFAAFSAVAVQQPNLLLLARYQYDQQTAREQQPWTRLDPLVLARKYSPPTSSPSFRLVSLTAAVILALSSYCLSGDVRFSRGSSNALAVGTVNTADAPAMNAPLERNPYKPLETTVTHGTAYGFDSPGGRGNHLL